MHRDVWLAIGLHTLIVMCAASIGPMAITIEDQGATASVSTLSNPLDNLLQWDSHWYIQIASQGYDKESVAFFPALPLLIYLFSFGGLIDTAAAGMVICNTAMIMVFYLSAKLGTTYFSQQTTRRALMAIAVMPTSVFLNSVYTEPLFLMFILAALLMATQQRWWLAGLAGAMAAATRSLGLAMALVLFVQAWHSGGGLNRKVLFSGIVPVGLGAYMLYLAAAFGNPLAFVDAQQAWERRFQWPWESVYRGGAMVKRSLPETGKLFSDDGFNPSELFSLWQHGTDLFLTLLWIALLVAALLMRKKLKIPIALQILGWMLLLTPLTSGTPFSPLCSLARFVLVIPTAYFVIAQLPKTWYRLSMTIFAILLVGNTILFSAGRFIG